MALMANDRLKQLGYDPDRGQNQALTLTFTRTGENEGQSAYLPDVSRGKSAVEFGHWSIQSMPIGVEHRIVVFADGTSQFFLAGERCAPTEVMCRVMDCAYRQYMDWAQQFGRIERIFPTLETCANEVAQVVDKFNQVHFLDGDFDGMAAGLRKVKLSCSDPDCRFAKQLMGDEPDDDTMPVYIDKVGHEDPFFAFVAVVVEEAVGQLLAEQHAPGLERFRAMIVAAPGKLDEAIAALNAPPAAETPVDEPVAEEEVRADVADDEPVTELTDDTVVTAEPAAPIDVDGNDNNTGDTSDDTVVEEPPAP